MTTPASETTVRNRSMAAHLSGLVGFVGVPSLVGPLVALLIWKDDPTVEAHAKEALNFQISWFIWAAAAALSIFVLVGFLLFPAVALAWMVLTVIGAVRASDGELYRYPLTIRFVS